MSSTPRRFLQNSPQNLNFYRNCFNIQINGPDGCIEDEHPADGKLSNEPGTLSMANTGRPNSGSCQFFINTVHNSYLDWFTADQSKHPVFGRVTEGMDVLKTIETTPTGPGDRPRTPVKMIKVTIHE